GRARTSISPRPATHRPVFLRPARDRSPTGIIPSQRALDGRDSSRRAPRIQGGEKAGAKSYSAEKSAAKAFGFKSSPVANFVNSFQVSVRPGAKTRSFMNFPTSFRPTYEAFLASAVFSTSRAIAWFTWQANNSPIM